MSLKVQNMVQSCEECPHRHYYSGGVYECIVVNQPIRDKDRIPSFCPLPEYPAQIIAELEATVAAYQRGHQKQFESVVLEHVAAKLKQNLSAGGNGVIVPIKDGSAIFMSVQSVIKMTLCPLVIDFGYMGNLYRLSPRKRGQAQLIGRSVIWIGIRKGRTCVRPQNLSSILSCIVVPSDYIEELCCARELTVQI